MSAFQKKSRLKIIAGQWRGRWVEFPDTQAIRPTPNRVRETLFNWLMTWIADSTCLDAFAGSGALSFEALSRGASHVLACEREGLFARAIQENAARFHAENLEIRSEDFFSVSAFHQFNIVFLDPPFHQNLLLSSLDYLVKNNLLAKDHRIYFEVEKAFDLSKLPSNIEIIKNQVAGEVRYGLLRVN